MNGKEKHRTFDAKKALQRAQALCSRQEKCISDIKTKLFTWGADKEQIKEIIDALIRDNFINEERYSRFFAAEKARFNKWGPKKIEQTLKLKGICNDDIRNALGEVEYYLTADALEQIIRNKAKGIKAKNDFDLKQKLIRFGVSRGFSYPVLIEIIDKMIAENNC